jgi:hypothetical protein
MLLPLSVVSSANPLHLGRDPAIGDGGAGCDRDFLGFFRDLFGPGPRRVTASAVFFLA